MKRKYGVLAVVAVLACGGVAMSTVTGSEGATDTVADAAERPTATEAIEQGDLTRTWQAKGTLGFASQRTLNAGEAGVVTWLPQAGSTIKRDGKLYEVNGEPVRLMYGAKPMYRTLEEGSTGEDVRQLKKNLIALGHGNQLAADDEFTAGTTRAVEAWQKEHGLKETGTVGPGQVAFVSGAVRVQETQAAVAGRVGPGAAVLTVTGSDRQVEFSVKVREAADLKAGDRVTVTLPGGEPADGRISIIGRTAEEDAADKDAAPKVRVTVELRSPSKAEGVDKAPVTVHVKGETRENVLHVPVGALLAGARGGFLIEVVEYGRAREVSVELGLFAQGRVEITGAGLRAGMKVGVAQT
ncbi:peptidoglycan-binding protein [Streptomyces sp. NPDC098781]|uniref:peptidoglycan-binding protein n=1 Tax=Streptomyces sp. NPDC098781 TaxID=3366097 RepID=UPI0037F1271C